MEVRSDDVTEVNLVLLGVLPRWRDLSEAGAKAESLNDG